MHFIKLIERLAGYHFPGETEEVVVRILHRDENGKLIREEYAKLQPTLTCFYDKLCINIEAEDIISEQKFKKTVKK